MESFKRYFSGQASCYTPPTWDLQARPCLQCFTATLSLDNLRTIILVRRPTLLPDKHIAANHNTTNSHQNRHTTATDYSHTVADHMFTHRTHTVAAIIIAQCQVNYNSLNRSSSCSPSTLDYTPSCFKLGSGCSNFVVDQDLYSFAVDLDQKSFTADIVLPTFSVGFVLTNFIVADFDWTSFAVQCRYIIRYRHIVIVVDVDSNFIASFDSSTVLDFLQAIFATAH